LPDTAHAVVVGDSVDLSFVADGSIALVVTSPPYPMIAMWDGHFRARDPAIGRALDAVDAAGAFELMHRDLDRVWAEVHRALGGRFQLHPNHARVLDACRRLGFEALPAVLWRKTTNAPNKFMGSGMLPAGAYVTLEHEYLLTLRKGGRRAFPDPGDRARRRASAYFWEERNTWFSDVWDTRGARQALGEAVTRKRSAAFPFEIAWRLVLMHSVPRNGSSTVSPRTECMSTSRQAISNGNAALRFRAAASPSAWRAPRGSHTSENQAFRSSQKYALARRRVRSPGSANARRLPFRSVRIYSCSRVT
jgi:DNA modification methylase